MSRYSGKTCIAESFPLKVCITFIRAESAPTSYSSYTKSKTGENDYSHQKGLCGACLTNKENEVQCKLWHITHQQQLCSLI